MHSLGLDLSPQDRAEHVRDVADQVWAEGTDFQRETTAELYGEIADGAAEDGALYAGVWFLALDDGQPASASLVVRAEETDATDAEVVALSIADGLSTHPGKEAYRTTAAGRPVAVVFSMVGSALDVEEEGDSTLDAAPAGTVPEPREPKEPADTLEPGVPDSPVLPVATAEAYVPLPEISRLLVLCISTPSLEIFPDLVALLSGITETLEVDADEAAWTAAGSAGGLRRSRIMEV